jgi:hypothetical protein
MGFDFGRLPRDKHESAIKMVRDNDLLGLLHLHDTYKLSDYSYSCCGLDGLLRWFQNGIDNGEITIDS